MLRDRDRMVFGFTTTCIISVYHHYSYDSNPPQGEIYSIQQYVIKIVSDLLQDGSFLRVFQFPTPNKTDRTDRAEILLKVTLNTTATTIIH